MLILGEVPRFGLLENAKAQISSEASGWNLFSNLLHRKSVTKGEL